MNTKHTLPTSIILLNGRRCRENKRFDFIPKKKRKKRRKNKTKTYCFAIDTVVHVRRLISAYPLCSHYFYDSAIQIRFCFYTDFIYMVSIFCLFLSTKISLSIMASHRIKSHLLKVAFPSLD